MTDQRTAETSVPIHPLLASRWSPRALDPARPVGDETVIALLEAARWAPSAGNGQPWRFVVARRGTPLHDRVFATLKPGNQTWAGAAPVLLVALAETADEAGRPRPTARYDLGAAVLALTVQASAEDLVVHQMAGFEADDLAGVLGVPDRLVPLTVVAVGHHAPAAALPDDLAERERAPRSRLALDELVLAADLAEDREQQAA